MVFERAASPESTVDLWLMRSDGSQMELLKQNAARPSWGVPSTAPPPSLEHAVYLPMWVRNND